MATFAAETFKDLFGYLNIKKEITKDNISFRIVTAGSFSVLIISAFICGLTSYFGSPIVCDVMKEDNSGGPNFRDLIEAHCWLHGTRLMTENYELNEGETCLTKQDEEHGGSHTLYYQWVVFMLILSAILLKLPALIWSMLEGNLMSTFHNEKNKGSGILKKNQKDLKEAVENEAIMFEKIAGSWTTNIYYLKFLACQLLALTVLIVNFHITDLFLNNKFKTYGTDVVEYFNKIGTVDQLNPMCNTFPTRVSCTMKKFGTSGLTEDYNSYCILRQNIINEKIYLFLWFWFAAMFAIIGLQLFWELCFLALPFVRQFLIFQAAGNKFLSSNMKAYLRKRSVGDVFVLYQMSKNTHSSFFYDLLEHLSCPNNEETEPLVKFDEGNEKMELKNTNQEA